jgi:hypothetical protein
MSDTRTNLFLHWSESLQKYDQFIAGILAAWVAYLVQSFHPSKLMFWPPNTSFLETLGILSLIIGLLGAVLRTGRLIDVFRISYDLEPYEAAKKQIEGIPEDQPVYRGQTGPALTPEERAVRVATIGDTIERSKTARARHAAFSRFCYHLRNVGGLLGILLLFASRIMEPYCR